jgi:hypothetical protein
MVILLSLGDQDRCRRAEDRTAESSGNIEVHYYAITASAGNRTVETQHA